MVSYIPFIGASRMNLLLSFLNTTSRSFLILQEIHIHIPVHEQLSRLQWIGRQYKVVFQMVLKIVDAWSIYGHPIILPITSPIRYLLIYVDTAKKYRTEIMLRMWCNYINFFGDQFQIDQHPVCVKAFRKCYGDTKSIRPRLTISNQDQTLTVH